MEFKKHYTDEELNEVKTWFQTHFDHLPTSLQMDKATFIKDLKQTVSLYYDILDKHKDNPTYAAQIHHIFMMRNAVREVWKNEGNNYE